MFSNSKILSKNKTASFRIVSKIKPKVKETCELEINNEVKLVEKEEVRKEKSVHFDVNEKPQSKIDSVIDQLKNRPQNEIIDTLLELILHQVIHLFHKKNQNRNLRNRTLRNLKTKSPDKSLTLPN